MIGALALSLAVTLAAELSLGWLLGLRRGREMAVVALMNVATNPPVVFVTSLARRLVPPTPWRLLTAGLELVVVAVEALALHKALERSWLRAFGLSAALNLGSWLAGEVVSGLLQHIG